MTWLLFQQPICLLKLDRIWYALLWKQSMPDCVAYWGGRGRGKDVTIFWSLFSGLFVHFALTVTRYKTNRRDEKMLSPRWKPSHLIHRVFSCVHFASVLTSLAVVWLQREECRLPSIPSNLAVPLQDQRWGFESCQNEEWIHFSTFLDGCTSVN